MTAATVAALVLWVLSLGGLVSVLRARVGFRRRVQRLLLTTAVALLAALATAGLMLMRTFGALTGETLVATVTTQPIAAGEFALTYQPAQQALGEGQTIRLRGDQWEISGGMVKWHPWLTALGLPSYHAPLRISGRFSTVQQQRAQPPTVHALRPDLDWFWEVLYRADSYLPFVEAVYGSSAFVPLEPKAVQEVYATPSGYLIKRVPASRRGL
ncbi:MAG: hypothetical protein HY353_00575 [Candidatus Omnitrophica bacterium]|nr:hypothetical protein [Candidatus Omnitrophota bacterium]